MRKALLAMTAMAALSLAGGASAKESINLDALGDTLDALGDTVDVGGYYEFGFASLDDNVDVDGGDETSIFGDAELFINYETLSDRGETFGIKGVLEVVHGPNQTEDDSAEISAEVAGYIITDYGTVYVGHDDSVYGRFLTWAPTHDGASTLDDTVFRTARLKGSADTGSATDTVDLAHTAVAGEFLEDNNAKITYVTPNFAGIQGGLSILSSNEDNDFASTFGLSYNMDLSAVRTGTTMKVTGASYNNNNQDTKVIDNQVGVTFDSGQWTVTAARYDGKTFDDVLGAQNQAGQQVSRQAFEFGVGYQLSDAISLAASSNTAATDSGNDDVGQTAGRPRVYNSDVEGDFQTLSGEYVIAPWAKTTMAVNMFAINATSAGDEYRNEGSEIVWQMEFSF